MGFQGMGFMQNRFVCAELHVQKPKTLSGERDKKISAQILQNREGTIECWHQV